MSMGTGARSPPKTDCTEPSNEDKINLSKMKGKQIMRILYINNQGGGFADYIQIEEGKTVEQFFKDKMPAETSTDYLIRVNRQPVPRDYCLQEGDRVTVTPTKIDGAR